MKAKKLKKPRISKMIGHAEWAKRLWDPMINKLDECEAIDAGCAEANFIDAVKELLTMAEKVKYDPPIMLPEAVIAEVRKPGAEWWWSIGCALVDAGVEHDERCGFDDPLRAMLHLTIGVGTVVGRSGIRAIRPSSRRLPVERGPTLINS